VVRIELVGGLRFLNLTPHDIRILIDDKEWVTIKRSGIVAGLQQVVCDRGRLGAFKIVEKAYAGIFVSGHEYRDVPLIRLIEDLQSRGYDFDCIIVSLISLKDATEEIIRGVADKRITPVIAMSPDTGPGSVIRDEKTGRNEKNILG